ncbi:ZZ-type zinc finger-containing protein 3 [Frankliniella fusca]|uniref:ZZ-type zinc finger-containing protein 3 n=1 Tax=Frankliniella fusca TaxID=407009 RepID=A0AAE1LE72_9NEOP|nr:ZZ-type zinc finger-containing protein 3 [Frankliniella fusca]
MSLCKVQAKVFLVSELSILPIRNLSLTLNPKPNAESIVVPFIPMAAFPVGATAKILMSSGTLFGLVDMN